LTIAKATCAANLQEGTELVVLIGTATIWGDAMNGILSATALMTHLLLIRRCVLTFLIASTAAICVSVCKPDLAFASHCNKAAWDRIGEGAILDQIDAAAQRADMAEICRLLPRHLQAMQQALRMMIDTPDCFHGRAQVESSKYRVNIARRQGEITRDCQR
jgi:hypothetical protein